MRLTVPALIVFMMLGSTGCSKVYVDQVARHGPDKDITLAKAPRDGAYQVHYNNGLDKNVKPISGTKRYFQKGDTLGFTSSDPDHFFAVANESTLPLPTLHKKGSGYIWYLAERRQTQFGREVQETLIGTGQVLGFVGYLALEGMLLAISATDEDCDDYDWTPRHHHRKDRDHARGDSPKISRPATEEERNQPIPSDAARGLKVPQEPRIK